MNRDQVEGLWRLEEQLWFADSTFYERTLAPGALMVLPEPAGVLDRAATIDSIRSAARWRHVVFEERHQVLSGPGTAVLVYSVQADRGTPATAYAARCSSTYVNDNGGWLLLQHHQTPMAQPAGSSA